MTDAPRTWGDSGLIVPVPEAEPVVGELRQAHDPVAEDGVPAHVTVLFPFVPRDEIDDALHAQLGHLFGQIAAFGYRFERVERFGTTTVYLAPEPAEAFAALTRHVADRWPEHPPYGGVYDVVVPHLTVGDQLTGPVADDVEQQAALAMERHGPLTGRADEVVLMTQGSDGRWSTGGRYPLAAGG